MAEAVSSSPKGRKGFRKGLCLDMRNAITATESTLFPLSTVDELIVKLRNATRFPKLDSNKAFYQLELDP